MIDFFIILTPILQLSRMPSPHTLNGEIERVVGVEGAVRPAKARLQAQLSFTPGCLQWPGDFHRYLWVGCDMQVFMLTVLPENSTQMPVFSNKRPCNVDRTNPSRRVVDFSPY